MPPVGDSQNNNLNQSNMGGSVPPTTPVTQDDGKTMSIIGLVLAFVGMQLIGLILSIIGFSKAKKAGAPKGLAIAGIVLNAIGMVIGTIIAIVMIVGIVNSANTSTSSTDNSNSSYANTDNKNEDKSGSSTSQVSSVTADDVYDMDKACTNSYSISNSAAYTKGSAKVAMFYNSVASKNYYSSLFSTKSSWKASSVSEVSLVVCMDASEGSSAGKSCEYDRDGTKISIPLYHTNYKVRIIEASTGKVLGTENLTTSGGDCPSFVSYDPSDPKVFEKVNGDAVEGILTPYAG